MRLYKNRFSLNKQKKIYLYFISMILLSVILGFLFYFIISDSNKLLVMDLQKDFFNNINDNKINYLSSFINSIISNYLYLFLIFLFGFSVVGFIFIIILILIKGFIVGFSISSIIGTFGLKGILLSFIYMFPHQIIFLIILLLIGFYGCCFCYRLFMYLFKRRMVNFNVIKNKYIKIFFISLIGGLFCSLYEVFVLPHLISFFM